MSSKQTTKKRGRINVVACNKCKRDKKKCDGSYLTQKPCKYCRDRKEYCEYTEPNRLRVNRIQSDIGDNEVVLVSSSNISDMINECENQHQIGPLRQKLAHTELCKSDLFLQLLTDPSTTDEQTVILKRLYNEVMRSPEDPKFDGDKRDELCTKLKLLSPSNNNNNHTKVQVWDDLCALVNELDKMITANREENDSTILNSLFNSWNSEFTSPTTIHTTDIFPSGSKTPRKVEIFSNDVTNPSTGSNNSNNQQTCDETVPNVRKNQNVDVNKKPTNSKKRRTRKNQKGNKRTQPYPAGGQIVIRPSKQAHTMIWHQNDPLEDVPIMAFHIQSPSIRQPPPKPQRTRPQPSFPHYQQIPSIPIDIWDHSTTMTMLSPKPNFSESESNETLPTTNSILLSPTPSLHDDIISSPSNSSIDHNMRMISDDEKDHFGFISLTQSTGSPQSPSLFTMEEFFEMCSSNDLPVESIWNC